MHISDGVLSAGLVFSTTAVSLAGIAYGLKGIREDDIPKISLMTATFFAFSMLSVSIGGITSAHPLVVGLLGIILGKQVFISLFVALLLQSVLFSHGGISSLGANMLIVGAPAMLIGFIYRGFKDKMSKYLLGGILGGLGVILSVIILCLFLLVSSDNFIPMIKIVLLSHTPILVIEVFVTGFAIGFIEKTRPEVLSTEG